MKKASVTHIPFFKWRTVSSCFDAASAFISQHRRLLFRWIGLLALPFAVLVGALIYSLSASSGPTPVNEDLTLNLIVQVLAIIMLAYAMMSVVTWTLMQRYLSHPQGLAGVTLPEVAKSLARNFVRVLPPFALGAIVLLFAIRWIFGVFIVGFFAIPLCVMLSLPIMLIPPAAIMGKAGIIKVWVHVHEVLTNDIGGAIMLLLVSLMTMGSTVVTISVAVHFINELCNFLTGTSQFLTNSALVESIVIGLATWFALMMLEMWILCTGYFYGSEIDMQRDYSLSRDIENFENL